VVKWHREAFGSTTSGDHAVSEPQTNDKIRQMDF
jgi:hypothetical protein